MPAPSAASAAASLPHPLVLRGAAWAGPPRSPGPDPNPPPPAVVALVAGVPLPFGSPRADPVADIALTLSGVSAASGTRRRSASRHRTRVDAAISQLQQQVSRAPAPSPCPRAGVHVVLCQVDGILADQRDQLALEQETQSTFQSLFTQVVYCCC